VLDEAGFDEFCEARCHKFYHEKLGRPSLAPGMYFRVMLIGPPGTCWWICRDSKCGHTLRKRIADGGSGWAIEQSRQSTEIGTESVDIEASNC